MLLLYQEFKIGNMPLVSDPETTLYALLQIGGIHQKDPITTLYRVLVYILFITKFVLSQITEVLLKEQYFLFLDKSAVEFYFLHRFRQYLENKSKFNWLLRY